MIQHFVQLNGLRLHYMRGGSGPTLLLLHGVTDHAAYWGWTARQLAQNFDVIAIDQRGHGLSDSPPSGYRLTDYVADAYAVLLKFATGPAIVVGHSFGGWVGNRLAAQHPELVRALILEDPPFAGQTPRVVTAQEADAGRYAWFAWLRDLAGLTREQLAAKCAVDNPGWSAEDCDHWATSKLQVRARIYAVDGIEFDTRWQDAATRVICPTLLIHGDGERGSIVTASSAAFAQTLIPACQTAYIAGAGHAIHRDQPQAMLSAMRAFIAGLSP